MKKISSLFCAALLTLWLTVGGAAAAYGAEQGMTVTFIDCDQGDSILIESNGKAMLVDGGKAIHAQAVEDCLLRKRIRTLEYVVASHPDEDHIGGLPQIYDRFQVNYSYYSPYKAATKCYQKYIDAIQTEPNSAYANPGTDTEFQVGCAGVQVLSDGVGAGNANDASLVLKVRCGSRSLLLTGDISSGVETRLVEDGKDVQADILKVAHHGSAGSSSTVFLNAAAPKYAAISVGADNSYGHPTAQALRRLQATGAKLYRTDQMGTIQMQVTAGGVTATTEKGSATACLHTVTNTIKKTTPATFQANGSTVHYSICAVCGHQVKTGSVKIPQVAAPKLSKSVFNYNGKAQKPTVAVQDATGKQLKYNTDYTVRYANGRKTVGRYGVQIQLKGKYKGTRTVYFTIRPKGTAVSKVTAGKQKITIAWKKQTAQTTGYQLQYSTSSNFKKAKTITVGKNTAVKKTVAGLQKGKHYYVRVRTYKVVKAGDKTTKYYSAWSKAKRTDKAVKRATPVGNTVYVSPTGKKYHYTKACAGKHPIKTTLSQAKKNHTPCKKCAM